MSNEGIRIPFPYFSVRFANKELVENYVLALLYMADTVLSELGYEEVNEENIGEVVRLFRQPILRLDEFRAFLQGEERRKKQREGAVGERIERVGNNYSQPKKKKSAREESSERGEGGGESHNHKQYSEAQVGAFVSSPQVSSFFEYPLVPEEKRVLVDVVYRLLKLSERTVEELDADN